MKLSQTDVLKILNERIGMNSFKLMKNNSILSNRYFIEEWMVITVLS